MSPSCNLKTDACGDYSADDSLNVEYYSLWVAPPPPPAPPPAALGGSWAEFDQCARPSGEWAGFDQVWSPSPTRPWAVLTPANAPSHGR